MQINLIVRFITQSSKIQWPSMEHQYTAKMDN